MVSIIEHIYTIPINEQFEKTSGCPICGLFTMLENNEISAITGASMMEPSIRVATNKMGFCFRHFDMMSKNGKRLPVALVIQSHLEKIRSDIDDMKITAQDKYLDNLTSSCYVCTRINNNLNNIYGNLFYLFKSDQKFRDIFDKQEYFCIPHYEQLLHYASKFLSGKEIKYFFDSISKIESGYLSGLQSDIDWFCKKFDYRFAKEDWKNSKDSIERSIYALTGQKPINKQQDT